MTRTERYVIAAVTGRPPRRSARAWSKRKPARNAKYRAWIRTLPCAVCGLEGKGLVEAAHTGSDGGTSMKASDYSCIPLCFDHHQGLTDSYHHGRDTFERIHQVDCRRIVRDLNRGWWDGRMDAPRRLSSSISKILPPNGFHGLKV